MKRTLRLLELTGRIFTKFIGLLELKVCTILLEFTGLIGLRTSTRRTGLVYYN